MKREGTLLFFIIYLSAALSCQEVKVTAAFDSSKIFLGDQVNYTITIYKPVSYLLSVPVFKDTLIKNIEILKGPISDTSLLKDGRVRIVHRYLVTSFDSGFYQVRPAYAELRSGNTIKRFYSDYSPLEVMRVKITPPDTTSRIFDIIKPYKAPLTIGEILPWILLAAVLSAAGWYIFRLIKKLRKPKTTAEPEVSPDPAHIIAFRELEKLKEDKLWQQGELKKYHTRLTEIIREYLENRYQISSLELTTLETLSELKRTGFRDDELFRKLKTILTGADLVKFAKYKPDATENELHYDYAWDFVSLTRYEEPGTTDEKPGEISGKKEGA